MKPPGASANKALLQPDSRKVRHIPSLDGLRAMSILLVLFGHGSKSIPLHQPRIAWIWTFLDDGPLGVMVFFVISGYLITYLLRRELEKTGSIDLRAFYVRRILRIFPAFYAFLAVIAALFALKIVPASLTDLALAGTYLWNYRIFTKAWNPTFDTSIFSRQGWYLGHVWSLSLEEQFYLFWPTLLSWVGLTRGLKIAVAIILAEPFVRVAAHFLFPSVAGTAMLPWALDPLMFGAAAAIFQEHPRFEAVWGRVSDGWIPALAGVFLLIISPLLSERFKGMYSLILAPTLQSAAIVLILFWLVRKPDSAVGHLFNLPTFKAIGVLSYSLYLWQQLFLVFWSDHLWTLQLFPINFFACFIAALCSYYLIERPFLRLKSRFARVPIA